MKSLTTKDGIVLILGFIFTQMILAFLITFFYSLTTTVFDGINSTELSRGTQHLATQTFVANSSLVSYTTMLSYLGSGLWAVWYVRKRNGSIFLDGSPTGIGICPAPLRAYFWAVLIAAFSTLIAFILFCTFKPKIGQPSDLVFHALASSTLTASLSIIMFCTVDPLIEEFIFRGGAMAAFNCSLKPTTAALIISVVFIAVHIAEKLSYPIGLIDICVLAAATAWLRIKYKSLKPSILLHSLYNIGIFFDGLILVITHTINHAR